jgi:hypothetical protein
VPNYSRVTMVVMAMLFQAGLVAFSPSPAMAAPRTLAVVPVRPDEGFDPLTAAEFTKHLTEVLKANGDNQIAAPDAAAALTGRPLADVASALKVRFVFGASIDKDIDAVSLRWELYDAVAGKVIGVGLSPGDIDNMEALPLEVAVQANLVMDQAPPT